MTLLLRAVVSVLRLWALLVVSHSVDCFAESRSMGRRDGQSERDGGGATESWRMGMLRVGPHVRIG